MTEETISHYRILGKLGEGGMGVVYRALDTRLERTVALKILPREAVGDPERRWRFEREAKAASALNHPNIVTIYDIDRAPMGEGEPVEFIAMECVEGETLDRVLASRRLSVEEALAYATQMAGALAAAHAAGSIHRAIKPGNVIVKPSGQIKMLDFGLAKLLDTGASAPTSTDSLAQTITAATVAPGTRQGTVLGTLAYMSPEQAQGKPVDARSDVFSLGCVLYEMLSGRRPFQGDSNLMTIAAILRDSVPPLKTVRPDVPADLEHVVERALRTEPQDRYSSAVEMHDDLEKCLRPRAAVSPAASFLGRPAARIALAAVLVLAAAAGTLYWMRTSRLRRAREVELPQIARLIAGNKLVAAMRLARRAEPYVPAEIAQLRREWMPVRLETAPPGASVYLHDYLGTESDWESLGRTPLPPLRIPLGNYRWRIVQKGFEPIESAAPPGRPLVFRLDPAGTAPPGMVHIPGGKFQLGSINAVDLSDYWLDKYEVTNREFKQFVDRGGYERKEYWKQAFVEEGRTVSWEEALGKFRDATGRPGPSTWNLGSFPEGHGDDPVGGVSWYEAAAYAEFAGKSLPTVYHWYAAAGPGLFSDILRVSNFGGKGPARAGTYKGLSPYGNYDMAGNVKEWVWNETGSRRYILGGSWNDPVYLFSEPEAVSPFDRSATNGFRCARYTAPLSTELTRSVDQISRDYSSEKPVSDDVFRVYKSFYSYDRGPLEAKTEAEDDTSPYWKKVKVSYRAAYGNERIPAFLFLPRNASPPYQTVVYFPSSQAQIFTSSEELDTRWLDFVIRSGRAALFPIYKETYERQSPSGEEGPSFRRDMVIAWSKDLGRSLDYLETRPDIDRGKFAFYGVSLGAIDGTVLVAIEDRFKAAVFLAGGFRFLRVPPEIDPINFAPRVKVPLLLIGGRQDLMHPLETAQKPLFRLLGTPEKDKRHVVFEGGHIPTRIEPVIKEILDWLDRYLGPVRTAG